MKKILTGLVLLLFVFIGLWIAQDNAQSVSITLLGFTVGETSLGLSLVLAFGVGVAVALLATLPLTWRLTAAHRKLQARSAEK